MIAVVLGLFAGLGALVLIYHGLSLAMRLWTCWRWPWEVTVLTCSCGRCEPVEWPAGVTGIEWHCSCGSTGRMVRGRK